MSKGMIVAGLLIMVVMCSLAATSVSAADVKWSKGDWWEYTWSAEESEMFNLNGTMEQEVTEVTSDWYVLAITGTATVPSGFMNLTGTVTTSISGSMMRAKSDFGSMSTSVIISASASSGGPSATVSMGITITATPPINDLPLNQVLAPGEHLWSNTTVEAKTWFNIGGLFNETDNSTTEEDLLLVVGANETVTTPAGTFECVKLSAGTGPDALTYYYSEKVGNYVKVTGSGYMASVAALGNLVLQSYSHGGGGIMSFITGKNLWITALIVVVIVVVVVSLIALRRRGRMQQMAPPPMQQAPPPPPT